MIFELKEFTLKNGITCQVRSAEEKDVKQFINFRKKTVGETYFMMWYPEEIIEDIEKQRKQLQKIFESEKDLMLMVFIEGKCIAVGGFYALPGKKSQHRTDFFITVKKDYWGLGIGNLLMKLIVEKSIEAGYEQIELSVYSDNERAISLYKKFGFEEWGRVNEAYKLKDGTYRDSVNMGLKLNGINGDSKAKEESTEEKWLKWAIELQSLAQAGLAYGKDIYDIERFERIREISAEIVAYKTEISVNKIKDLFCNEVGYQTPKIDTRAAIFQDDRILLVQENNGKWTLPGGWADVYLSVKENVVKETKEEAGIDVEPKMIISVLDVSKNNKKVLPFGIYKIFVLCEYINGKFEKNIETVDSGYFSLENLPELDNMKITIKQIKMCFEANKEKENWKVIFD